MQYSFVLLAALTGAMALPQYDNKPYNHKPRFVVQLSGPSELATQTDVNDSAPPTGSSGPYDTINILAQDPKDFAVRCRIFDTSSPPRLIPATRGANLDNTFSDGGPDSNEWKFLAPSEVSLIECSDAFVQVNKADVPKLQQVNVELRDEKGAYHPTVVGPFKGDGKAAETLSVWSHEKFTTVNIKVGPLTNPALRCAVFDEHHNAIEAQRGANIDVTFSDAGKGEWQFINENGHPLKSKVSAVTCDPAFKSLN